MFAEIRFDFLHFVERPTTMRRSTLRVCIAAVSLLHASVILAGPALLPDEPAASSPPRMNVVFLYADDLGYGDLACYGSQVAQTPRLDRLAQQGTRFTQFYVSHCVCSPTRCSAITGHFPSRHQVYQPIMTYNSNASVHMGNYLVGDIPSLPRALQQAGYRTAMIGKWHLGGGSGHLYAGKLVNDPTAPDVASYGFDHVRVTFGNGPTWKDAEPVSETHDLYPYDDRGWQRWSSKAVADETIRFLDDHVESHSEEPFYANVWFKDAHTPFNPTDEMLAPFKDLPEPSRTHYAMIRFMDQQIGRVIDKIDSLGLAEKTLVIFSSDNGAATGRGGSNSPFRGWKWTIYEGGIREPLIVRWPGQVPAGRVDRTSVLNIVDFIPTFCRLSGAQMPEGYDSDGVDITDAFAGRPFERRRPMFWHHPRARKEPVLATRDGDMKLLINPDNSNPELYNLEADPSETTNLAANKPADVQRLAQPLIEWYRTLAKPYGTGE